MNFLNILISKMTVIETIKIARTWNVQSGFSEIVDLGMKVFVIPADGFGAEEMEFVENTMRCEYTAAFHTHEGEMFRIFAPKGQWIKKYDN